MINDIIDTHCIENLDKVQHERSILCFSSHGPTVYPFVIVCGYIAHSTQTSSHQSTNQSTYQSTDAHKTEPVKVAQTPIQSSTPVSAPAVSQTPMPMPIHHQPKHDDKVKPSPKVENQTTSTVPPVQSAQSIPPVSQPISSNFFPGTLMGMLIGRPHTSETHTQHHTTPQNNQNQNQNDPVFNEYRTFVESQCKISIYHSHLNLKVQGNF